MGAKIAPWHPGEIKSLGLLEASEGATLQLLPLS
jgi:hypothetical protein